MSAKNNRCSRLICAAILCVLVFVTSPLRADVIGLDSPQLSRYEREMAARVKNCRILARENILLVWPDGMQPTFAPSSGVTSIEGMADWLESAYKLMREWTFYDPNATIEKRNGERTRLAFLWNGSKNYHPTRGHAYIGAGIPHTDENWFGYICHELSHDFFHAHPDFRGRLTGWNEGACDYMRYHLLRAMGMSHAAEQWEKALYRANPDSRYRGKARQILDLERKNNLSGPFELLQKLKGRDINFVIAGITPQKEFLGQESNDALVAVWDFEAQNDDAGALTDKAPSGAVADTLKILGAATIKDGVAIIPAAKGAALQAASSADLELSQEMTLWLRFRVARSGKSIVSLVDKRHFKKPEARSYGFYLMPTSDENSWALGGQISGDGTRGLSLGIEQAAPAMPVGEWREAAMIVRRVEKFLSVVWLVSNTDSEFDMEYNAPSGQASRALNAIFQSSQPLIIGNDANLKANATLLEFDEVRIYNRALSEEDCIAIVPGEFSQ